MAKQVLALATCAVASVHAGSQSIYLSEEYVEKFHVKMWEDYKKGYKREYSGAGKLGSEDHKRMVTFRDNLFKVHKLVEANPDAAFGFNTHSDKSAEEFAAFLPQAPFAPADAELDKNDYVKTATEKDLDMEKALPRENILRYEVGHTKHQGACAVGAVFGAMAGVENLLLRAKQYRVVSEQYALSCAVAGKGCNCKENSGCSPRAVYHSLIAAGGDLPAEVDYMYESAGGDIPACKETEGLSKSGRLAGFYTLQNHPEFLKRWIDQKGTFVASVANTNVWHLYQEGIMKSSCGKGAPTHAVAVYGYGLHQGKEYFLAKNSLGSAWGQQGAIMLDMHADCLIDPIAPIVEKASTTGSAPSTEEL
eukprot:TRINITY_DN28465_c0_g1_i1.p2 TRINITY_DN28465_c0_g1~~TRINITY_DN28465_c0_g1_i1.p2  ORF type:complete len:364 (+),score=134.18 TRINITY_DN28465_c0_g1_i1:47-1138(+)